MTGELHKKKEKTHSSVAEINTAATFKGQRKDTAGETADSSVQKNMYGIATEQAFSSLTDSLKVGRRGDA